MYSFPCLFMYYFIYLCNCKVRRKFIYLVLAADVMERIEHGSWKGNEQFVLCMNNIELKAVHQIITDPLKPWQHP